MKTIRNLILTIGLVVLTAIAAQAQVTLKELPTATKAGYDANYVIEVSHTNLTGLGSSTNVDINVFPAPGTTNTFLAGQAIVGGYVDLTAFRNSAAGATNLLIRLGDLQDDDRIFTAFQANNGDTNRPFFYSASTVPFVYTNRNRLILNVQMTNATAQWTTFTSGVARIYLRTFPVTKLR